MDAFDLILKEANQFNGPINVTDALHEYPSACLMIVRDPHPTEQSRIHFSKPCQSSVWQLSCSNKIDDHRLILSEGFLGGSQEVLKLLRRPFFL